MGRRTVTLDEEAEAIIEEKVEEGDAYESVSALVRESLEKV
jgi:Arc/MetJ-type ribon-helix-helix transcriptional regulator